MSVSKNSDWIETLLRAERAVPVKDEGFVERLLPHLPPRRRRWGWIAPAMTTLGILLALLSLGGPGRALFVLRHTEVAGGVPLILLLPLLILLVSSLWALSDSQ